MAFFLLKWVYNAVALEDDNGDFFVTHKSLLSQLEQNAELLTALNRGSLKKLEAGLNDFRSQVPGSMTWQEFMSFFFTPES